MGFNRWQAGAGFTWQNVNDPAWGTLQAKALASSSIADAQQTVVTANKYMAQQNWVISMDTPNYFALYQPWLKGYNAQNFSISGGTGSDFLSGSAFIQRGSG